jgi:type II secretory pathway pseudopilin PulG
MISPDKAHGTVLGIDGFTLIELLVSTLLLLTLMAASFRVVAPRQRGVDVEAETSDLQQRLRNAVDSLSTDLIMAGAGATRGERAGSLFYSFASILPYRRGLRNSDAPGSYRPDTITIVYTTGAAQTTIAERAAALSGDIVLASGPGCPVNDPSCGFKVGATALIFDDTGAFDVFTVTAAQGAQLSLQHNLSDEPRWYPVGSTIVEAVTKTYYLKADTATDTFQLIRYDGGRGADVPVVDHLVGLAFEYFGEPLPPQMRKPADDPVGPWTTYGPRPPPATEATSAYPPGENCVFGLDATSTPVPRLSPMSGGGPSLVAITPAQLSDGPWCPDAISPNRYDADLLRIRKVAVTLRAEAALASLRGLVGSLFTRGGTSDSGLRLVPDQEIRLQVSPRNLNLGR